MLIFRSQSGTDTLSSAKSTTLSEPSGSLLDRLAFFAIAERNSKSFNNYLRLSYKETKPSIELMRMRAERGAPFSEKPMLAIKKDGILRCVSDLRHLHLHSNLLSTPVGNATTAVHAPGFDFKTWPED